MHTPAAIRELSETHTLGDRTICRVAKARAEDRRPWIRSAPVCSMLAAHRIAHAGVMTAHHPYRVVRMHQGGLYFLACIEGEGRVLVDGRWQKCGAGMAVALPPFMVNAFEAVKDREWKCCWVRYEQQPEQKPILSSSSPVMARYDGRGLWHAIEGLVAEASGIALPAAMFHWIELVQNYVERFAEPWQQDDRLWRLWEKVSANVGHDWTLYELAAEAHVSAEHLRRLCRRSLGRSPMHHVTWLRMRKAAELLSTTPLKVETVANAVGYQNAFVFSNTFKKWIGWRPSEHRGRR
ncbi:MAG: AraC family transcriptional regulator [Verrucomicrobiaceae bacterium]|nr:AraC family transcriptional regulator [Verrucomicrobiaceae bacterium]